MENLQQVSLWANIIKTIIAFCSMLITGGVLWLAYKGKQALKDGINIKPSEKLEMIQLYHEFSKFYRDIQISDILKSLKVTKNLDECKIKYLIMTNRENEGESPIETDDGVPNEYFEMIELLEKLFKEYNILYRYMKNFFLLEFKNVPIFESDVKKTALLVGELVDALQKNETFTVPLHGYLKIKELQEQYLESLK